MNPSVPQLIAQLADPDGYREARASLVAMGEAAVPDLLQSLAGELTVDQRKSVLRILLENKDPRAEQIFRNACLDEDEEIRAIGARGLFLLGTADALEACLATINDAPDMLHFDMTPSVQSLISLGLPGLAAVQPLLNAEEPLTRRRAQTVFEQVTRAELERRIDARPLSNRVQDAWQALWQQNGDYRWDAPQASREAAAELWGRWLKEQLSEEPGES
jgi:hypothetical protein